MIVMATAWAEDDLPGRVASEFKDTGRLRVLRFPALNEEGEPGYNPALPLGALVPALHSREKLLEFKKVSSAYWWAALYQQQPMAIGGTVFKSKGLNYYSLADLPKKFSRVVASVDCTFKDTDGTDYVVIQVWGKAGPNVYLLDQVRERMSFTATEEIEQ